MVLQYWQARMDGPPMRMTHLAGIQPGGHLQTAVTD
jgi:hypothetical protein